MKGRKVIGPNLWRLREEAALKRSELGLRLGCTGGHIRNIERWGYEPSAAMADRIAQELTAELGRTITLDDFTYETAADEDVEAAA